MLILNTCIHPILADVNFKMANPYDRAEMWGIAIDLDKAAIDLVPQEDFYYIYLGRAQMQQALVEQDADLRELELAQALETLERAQTLNPLNPDHIANLARFHRMTAGLETDPAARTVPLHIAGGYYDRAMTVAPQNVLLLNEWATLQWQSGDVEQACQMVDRSFALAPEYEQTHLLYSDMCPQALPDQPQNLDFED